MIQVTGKRVVLTAAGIAVAIFGDGLLGWGDRIQVTSSLAPQNVFAQSAGRDVLP